MNVQIANRLAELRREHHLSQEDLAHKLGLSRQAVSKWERAESSPDTDNLIALAKLYGTSLDSLLKVESGVEDDVFYEQEQRASAGTPTAAAAAASGQGQNDQAVAATAQAAAAAAQAAAEAAKAVSVNSLQGRTERLTKQERKADKAAAKAAQAYANATYQGADGKRYRKHTQLWAFPYPLLVVIVYLVIGFAFGWWHPGWLLFLTVPLYYWACSVVDHDLRRQREAAAGDLAGKTVETHDRSSATVETTSFFKDTQDAKKGQVPFGNAKKGQVPFGTEADAKNDLSPFGSDGAQGQISSDTEEQA
ncbi:MAG: helix-turn-helix domain-containing protein [Coriobacteriales bacterium]|nr:helix-turn-helix domain-containing protein [Coriobacteriales bacterium]